VNPNVSLLRLHTGIAASPRRPERMGARAMGTMLETAGAGGVRLPI
jgi:hypothetical protein